jgi:hypothetical protein
VEAQFHDRARLYDGSGYDSRISRYLFCLSDSPLLLSARIPYLFCFLPPFSHSLPLAESTFGSLMDLIPFCSDFRNLFLFNCKRAVRFPFYFWTLMMTMMSLAVMVMMTRRETTEREKSRRVCLVLNWMLPCWRFCLDFSGNLQHWEGNQSTTKQSKAKRNVKPLFWSRSHVRTLTVNFRRVKYLPLLCFLIWLSTQP